MATLAFGADGSALLLLATPLNLNLLPEPHPFNSEYGPFSDPTGTLPWAGNYGAVLPDTVIDSQPTAAPAGAALPAITVHVNREGILDTTFNDNVTASKKSGVPTFVGTLVKAATNGVVVFNDFVPSGGGPMVITFTPRDRDPVDSDPIDVLAPATVNVSPSTASILIGATQAFTAEVLDQNDDPMEGQTVTWASDDEAVATIGSSSGVATGVDEGTCTITATCEGVDGTASLEVTPAPSGSSLSLSLALNTGPLRLGIGIGL